MRHQRAGKKLGRDSAHRKALYSNLAGALIEHGRIKTTVTKAKAVRPIAEQMITLGRRGDLHARRQAVAFLRSKDVVHKLFAEVGPSFAERPGGYTRIIRIGPRAGDASEMAYLELVDTPLVFKGKRRSDGADETAPTDDATPEAETELDEGESDDDGFEDEEPEDGEDENGEEDGDGGEPEDAAKSTEPEASGDEDHAAEPTEGSDVEPEADAEAQAEAVAEVEAESAGEAAGLPVEGASDGPPAESD
jgi:large subunit ribosomal protein L17